MSYVSSISQPKSSSSNYRKTHTPVKKEEEKLSTIPIPQDLLLNRKSHGTGVIHDTKLLESRERYAKLSKKDLERKEHRKREEKGRSRDRTLFARVTVGSDESDGENAAQEDPSPRSRSHSPKAFHGGIHALDSIMLRMPKSSFEGPNPCAGALEIVFCSLRSCLAFILFLFFPPLTLHLPTFNPPTLPHPPTEIDSSLFQA